MKIRTITTGFSMGVPLKEEQIIKIANFANYAKKVFKDKRYNLQTIRISTQPWEEYFRSENQIIELVKELESYTRKYNIDYFNIGTTKNPKLIKLIYYLLKSTSNMFCTSTICDDKNIDYEASRQTAKLIKRLSKIRPDGFDNLRFAALFNTKPGSPFFPAAYHEGANSFAIGTENSDLIYKSFLKAKDIKKASAILKKVLTDEFKKIENIAKSISKKEKIKYDGIDVSIATSVKPEESIAYAFEKLRLGKFGEAGTLAIAKIITDTLKSLNIKKCGYSGLMLPVLEDYGLAMRNKEATFNLTNLLLYSAICGTGLDTIPLPGNVSEKKLYSLLLDIASLSLKLDKPLSARLMIVPNKKIGEMTDYKFEYFVNSKIMRI